MGAQLLFDGRSLLLVDNFAEFAVTKRARNSPPLYNHHQPKTQPKKKLRRDVLPALDAAGVDLFLVSIGTPERAKDFVRVTGFPPERLFADPTSATYAALGLVKGVGQTFFSWRTPLAFKARIERPGGMDDLKDVLTRWEPWIPPRQDQALQQGALRAQ